MSTMNKINTLHPELQKLMDVLKFRKVDTLEEMQKIFDITKTDADGTPEITTEQKTVVVFDNSDFNSTYIIDMVNLFFNYGLGPVKTDGIDFVYVDNPILRRDLFFPGCEKNPENKNILDKLSHADWLERNMLRAGVIVVNPVQNQIVVFLEGTFNTLDQETINGALNWLWSEEEGIVVLGKNEKSE